MKAPEVDLSELNQLLAGAPDESQLIPALQRVQDHYGYIPPQALEPVAEAFRTFPAKVQGVVSFYHMFYTEPRGRHVVTVCRGTACHVKGGKGVLRVVQKILGLADGETSGDYQFSLETVACLGACALSPVMVVDGTMYGRLNPKRIENVLALYARKD